MEIRVTLWGRFQPRIFTSVKRGEKPHVIAFKFRPVLKYELGHAHHFSCAKNTQQKSM